MTNGDGHDLRSQRFAGDEVLEACYDNERVLRRGDRGSAVEKIQDALIFLGFPVPRVGTSGIFGDETELAVRSYQEARGLKVDGVIGSETIESLDSEFATEAPEPPVLATEPPVSEVPTPLEPESPVKQPRASPVRLKGDYPEPERAPPAPPVEESPRPPAQAAPAVEPVRAPEVKPVHAPPVPPVQEVSAWSEHKTRNVETVQPSAPPLTSSAAPLPPQADNQGRRFHSSGIWNLNSSLDILGGQTMHFKVKNLHDLASTVRIKANTGESQGALIQSQGTADFEFSTAGGEPFAWRFDIELDTDTALLEWNLYSNWVPESYK